MVAPPTDVIRAELGWAAALAVRASLILEDASEALRPLARASAQESVKLSTGQALAAAHALAILKPD